MITLVCFYQDIFGTIPTMCGEKMILSIANTEFSMVNAEFFEMKLLVYQLSLLHNRSGN